MPTHFKSKHGVIGRSNMELFMVFTDLRNLTAMIPANEKALEKVSLDADFDNLRISANGININVRITDRVRVRTAEAFDVETESLLFIPVQNLMYNQQEDVFEKTDGDSIYVPFVYSVTKDGDIELKVSYFGSAYDDMGACIRGYDLKYTKTKSIDVPSPGTIVLEMECGYYDFASNKFRTCSVVFRYGRVSYSDRIQ